MVKPMPVFDHIGIAKRNVLIWAMAAPDTKLIRLRQQSYQEHAEAVLRLAKTYLKDQAKAEDLTHDVFERLWRGNQFQEDKGSLRSYLLMMTRSMALNQLNQNKNRRSILERWRGEFKQQTASSEPELQASERAAELQLCLAKLSEKQRQIIEQCYLQGKTQQQIADEMAMPLGSVKTNARRGLMAIRQMLERSRQGEQAA